MGIKGEITVPGDKSVTQRAIIMGGIAKGRTRLIDFPEGSNCKRTIECMEALGVTYTKDGKDVIVEGRGLRGLHEPSRPLFCGGSGTLARILPGILVGQSFSSVVSGDQYLSARPNEELHAALEAIGANAKFCVKEKSELRENKNYYLPLEITGSNNLHGVTFDTTSPPVRSMLMLASLYSEGESYITESIQTRNYTEKMLKKFGADIEVGDRSARIRPGKELVATEIPIPGDMSSAAFFIALATLIPGSELLIKNVGINPTRTGLVEAMIRMGADIQITNVRNPEEPIADLIVKHAHLKGTCVEYPQSSDMLDEVAIFSVVASFAEGDSKITGVSESRVQECDRLNVMAKNLNAMGGDVEELPDGLIIHGGKKLHRAPAEGHGDHRIGMSIAVARLACGEEPRGDGTECVDATFPSFFDLVDSLQY